MSQLTMIGGHRQKKTAIHRLVNGCQDKPR